MTSTSPPKTKLDDSKAVELQIASWKPILQVESNASDLSDALDAVLRDADAFKILVE